MALTLLLHLGTLTDRFVPQLRDYVFTTLCFSRICKVECPRRVLSGRTNSTIWAKPSRGTVPRTARTLRSQCYIKFFDDPGAFTKPRASTFLHSSRKLLINITIHTFFSCHFFYVTRESAARGKAIRPV